MKPSKPKRPKRAAKRVKRMTFDQEVAYRAMRMGWPVHVVAAVLKSLEARDGKRPRLPLKNPEKYYR